MKSCPECRSEIPDDASTCRHCGQRVEGKQCPDCLAVVPHEARRCRWCGYGFQPPAPKVDFEPFMVSAGFVPTLLVRKRFLSQSIKLTLEKITISTPGPFGLTTREEEIPWKKVAGFDYHSGIVWDAIIIETRGQSSSVIGCLTRKEGARIRAVLQQLEQ